MKVFIPFAVLIAVPSPATAKDAIPHPQLPCWLSIPTFSADRNSEVESWSTSAEQGPYLITHDRDQIYERGELSQDYNFITYWFGNPAAPIQARHYLGESEVSLILSGDEVSNVEEVRGAIPPEVACYLQKRFRRITALFAEGYREIWSVSDD